MTNNAKVRFTFRLSSELMKYLKEDANKQGVSVNSLIIRILWDYYEKK